jgi:Na+-driven multidrug efflux pump
MDKKSAFLGEEKISKLLVKLSTPVIIGMLAQALYNIIDTLFVGRAYGAKRVPLQKISARDIIK